MIVNVQISHAKRFPNDYAIQEHLAGITALLLACLKFRLAEGTDLGRPLVDG